MAETPKKTPGGRRDAEREDRLKAALKANIARRKAQTRARKSATRDEAPGED